MGRRRRLIILDEADLLGIKVLEMMRNLNEVHAFPIVLIGEDKLVGRIYSRRRLSSRIRRKMDFDPISQHDIAFFLRQSFGLQASPEIISPIHRYSNGDWRPVLTVAAGIERAMQASGLNEPTITMVKDVIKNS